MEGATISIDSKGRILLPAWARKTFKGGRAVVHRGNADQLIIEPVMSIDEAFGSLKGKLDIEGFRKEHARER